MMAECVCFTANQGAQGTAITTVGSASVNLVTLRMDQKLVTAATAFSKVPSIAANDTNQFFTLNSVANCARTTAGFKRTGRTSSAITIIKVTYYWDNAKWVELSRVYGVLPPNLVRPHIVFAPDYYLAKGFWHYIALTCEHAYADEGLDIDVTMTMTEIGGAS